MFAKIFSQIFDSSIVENPELRFTFMDMLVLADQNGVVDMTHEAISRRTNRPVELIRKTISELESADNRSRSPEFDGARIKRLDDHRDWGWLIVNYDYFRKVASEEQRREKTLARVHKHRGIKDCNALKRIVTQGNACNAKQKQKQKQKQKKEDKKREEVNVTHNATSCSSDFLSEIKGNSAYNGIDIDREIGRMRAWLLTPKGKGRKLTKTFMVNWLNRIDVPLLDAPRENVPAMPDDRPDDVLAACRAMKREE